MAPPRFLENRSLRMLLFGGKGGVGKTTCASATALFFARGSPQGSFLLVSTDPAHSLADSIAGSTTPPNLEILEFNAKECLETFKVKHGHKLREIASRGTFLDDEDISQFLDLSLPGLDELMGFLEISRWADDESYDCIIVDTAPAGHTLRLLGMPELIRKWLKALDTLLGKYRYMKKLFSGSYRRDEIDDLLLDLSSSVKHAEDLLQDPVRCRFIPIMLAETLSIQETLMLLEELKQLNIPVADLVVNKLYPESDCLICNEGRAHQVRKLRRFREELSYYSAWGIPMYPGEVRGVEPLKSFLNNVFKLSIGPSETQQAIPEPVYISPRVEVHGPPPSPEKKLLVFAGKGGVGKTTLACATAVYISRNTPDKEVFLFSVDPAHSLSACLDAQVGPQPTRLTEGLTAMEIDGRAEFETLKEQYAEELEGWLGDISPNIDLTFDREVMERILDLSPPGIDEVMAFTLAMELLVQGKYDALILDSAPTGHLIRLLELPELIDQWLKVFFNLFLKYKRIFRLPKISQRLVKMSKELKQLRTVMEDPEQSALYPVSILTEMALEETKDLVTACGRIGLHVPAIFFNIATPKSKCSLCSALHKQESQVKDEFERAFSGNKEVLVYRQSEPRGLRRLGELGAAIYGPTQKESPA